MSKEGIKLFAKTLSDMQEARHELLMGDNQDICLGQLLDDAKDSVKDQFCKITLGKVKSKKRKQPLTYDYSCYHMSDINLDD